jgi:hypothetical protein
MKNQLVALSLAMLAATVFVPSAKAQRRAGAASARGGQGVGHLRRGGRFFAGSTFVPDFYSDYGSGIIEAPPPQTIVVQAAQPAPLAPVRNPPESLVLELQGDHWVRITSYGQSQTDEGKSSQAQPGASNLPSVISPTNPRRAHAAEPPSELPLPPAVLVFRDGHQEEIGKYMIVGTTIYTRADYWSSGSWTRKVQIAELDVPETLKLNQGRGAKFSLPSSPNEVMIRP